MRFAHRLANLQRICDRRDFHQASHITAPNPVSNIEFGIGRNGIIGGNDRTQNDVGGPQLFNLPLRLKADPCLLYTSPRPRDRG